MKNKLTLSAIVLMVAASASMYAFAVQNVWICEQISDTMYGCYIGGTRG